MLIADQQIPFLIEIRKYTQNGRFWTKGDEQTNAFTIG